MKSKAARIGISAFLFFHIVAIACWCLPINSALMLRCRDAVRPYMLWSGLFQGWDMFAPNPRSINAFIEATMVLNDGRIKTWKFPRMEQLGFVERYYRERYRKFVENLQNDANAALWPDVARHIARLEDNASNPPKIVILIRYWSEIPPPTIANDHAPETLHAHIFYEYDVKREDLE